MSLLYSFTNCTAIPVLISIANDNNREILCSRQPIDGKPIVVYPSDGSEVVFASKL